MNVQLHDCFGKREAVLNSTLSLVGKQGFHGTPMSQIAKNAGVAAGTIYHYFPSKGALISELYVYVKDQLAKAIIKGDDPSKSYKERFFAVMVSQYRFYIENPDSMNFLEQYVTSPYAQEYANCDSQLFVEKVITFFKYGIENAYFKNIDPRLLAPTIRGTLVAAANFQLSQHMLFSDEDINEVISIIWDGIKRQ
ncbi:TetR/AcrR family transcriptional regulator [Pedobacter antarcticus]|uniref:TetR/AcrR family transcriptional regulator n=1 Tax=Pedobacter antarcticus TaxID=34086 RepID=UPI001C5795F8|nr:TetR/AcrR family transcriptional regulator [Pedobacter antarcticus]